ncbi:hypothetical protein [Rhodospirillum sp. A1_3_36]|uniref:hypothetical protein n=1 Tax=Rhodospirillum sp. A1_3_36 TaxID=3391666 RepID=UPI0039A6BA6A
MLDDDAIILAQVGDSHWLLEGERHLDALLAADAAYPTPVHCIRFASALDLTAALPDNQGIRSLWSIHPGIIERLTRHDELVTIDAPAPPPAIA